MTRPPDREAVARFAAAIDDLRVSLAELARRFDAALEPYRGLAAEFGRQRAQSNRPNPGRVGAPPARPKRRA